jgi:hypothetical protein
MKIQTYKFGELKIDGKIYNSDLVLTENEIKENWLRQTSHLVRIKDIEPLLELNPTRLIIGTGWLGLMKVDLEVKKILRERNIILHVMKTKRALRTYKSVIHKGNVVAALHLTC